MYVNVNDYLGDVVDFGELESDSDAGEVRGDERSSVRERSELEIGGLRTHRVG